MADNYLLLIDTTQTQGYIFGSNRLRENIGASYLVAQATMQWVLEAVTQTQTRHNVGNAATLRLQKDRHFDRDNLDAEVMYVGGGNGVIIFRDRPAMERFVRPYTRRVLCEAPDLNIYTAEMPFDYAATDRATQLAETVQKLFVEESDRAKRLRPQQQPLLGLGVTAACYSTGLPAVTYAEGVGDDPDQPVSAAIAAKLAAAAPTPDNQPSAADAALRVQVPLDERHYRYPGDFDDMVAGKGEANYIAIVHADGDGIGTHVSQLGIGAQWDNRTYINARRELSEGLRQAAAKALQQTLAGLTAKLQQDSHNGDRLLHFYGNEEMEIRLAKVEKEKYLYYVPFRPLISGGDDVTFVCHGRIGLALAVNYCRAFRRATRKLLGADYSASAGVAIVRTHYPFARAYDLAEDLMASAKSYRREKGLRGGALDWHFTVGGLYGALDKIRAREYVASDGKNLTLRPVVVDSQPSEIGNNKYRSWPTVAAGIDRFQEPLAQNPEWSTRRNKVKALRDALREGTSAVKRFRTMFLHKDGLLPPLFDDDNQYRTDGFYSEHSGYFDALELSDWYFPIPEGAGDAA